MSAERSPSKAKLGRDIINAAQALVGGEAQHPTWTENQRLEATKRGLALLGEKLTAFEQALDCPVSGKGPVAQRLRKIEEGINGLRQEENLLRHEEVAQTIVATLEAVGINPLDLDVNQRLGIIFELRRHGIPYFAPNREDSTLLIPKTPEKP